MVAMALLAPASAQGAVELAGGALSYTTPTKTFEPYILVSLRPSGTAVGVHVETSLRCGRDFYDVAARGQVSGASGALTGEGAGRVSLAGGVVRWSWTLSGRLDGETATGEVRVAGVRHLDGKRTTCDAKSVRPFAARAVAAPATTAASPVPGATYAGASGVRLGGRHRGPVVVRVDERGRAAALWSGRAPCRVGRAQPLVNFTTATAVRADGSFVRAERFSQRFVDARVRYLVRFAGRFTGDGATGTLRARATIIGRRTGTVRTRCDTGARGWSVRQLPAGAPAPVPPAPEPVVVEPGPTATPDPEATPEPAVRSMPTNWSSQWVGDTYPAAGTLAFGPPDRLELATHPWFLSMDIRTAADDTNYSGGLEAPAGETLRTGVTYVDSSRFEHPPDSAGMIFSGDGFGCTGGSGSFIFHTLTRAPDGAIATADVEWEFYCDVSDSPMHGRLVVG
jgi:hypothetical protein